MFEQQPQALQQKVKLLASESIHQDNPSQWFEVLYAEANGDSGQIPWARLTPHPDLQDWLERNTPQGSGRSALVVGCGLGDDAEALAQQGFQVTAFDISPTAIAWCQKRFPNSQVNYQVADLFALEPAWHQNFDFVFECRNIQALPLKVRSTVINAIASLVAPGGTLLVITRFRDSDTEPDGPPWPLSDTELAYFEELGLQEIHRDTIPESEDDPIQRLRIEYNREYSHHGS
ncbi:MAG: methyltransferase domain-containing protein [Moorea sp. SIO3G5]|nr:methyltransferase domain-containing protein [Moorena sp. SIO3G5]